MSNEQILHPFFQDLYWKIKEKNFLIDKSNAKLVEIMVPRLVLNPENPVLNFGNKKTAVKYCEKEIQWYLSQDLSIKNWVDDIKIWNDVASNDKQKLINSNYGWCIFSKKNYNQYKNCIEELKSNSYSRRAYMIYIRPSMWEDYNKNGMNDFICTIGVQIFIRNNSLIYIINQRSLDIWYSLIGADFYWHSYVYNKIYSELLSTYSNLKKNKIIWIPNSMHLYEVHFDAFVDLFENFYEK